MTVARDMDAHALIAEHVLDVTPAADLAALIRSSATERGATSRATCALSLLADVGDQDVPTTLAALQPGESGVIAQAALEVLPASSLEHLRNRLTRRLDRRYPSDQRAAALAACRLLRRAMQEAELQCR